MPVYPGQIVFPQETLKPAWKILIDGKDYSDFMSSAKVVRPVEHAISGFHAFLANPDGQLAGLFNGGESVQIYADFGTATNQIFNGILERNYAYLDRWGGSRFRISGRGEEVKLFERYVTVGFTDEDPLSALQAVLDAANPSTNYFTIIPPGVNFGANITMRFQDVPCWQVIKYISQRAQCRTFVDTSRQFNFFPERSMSSGLTAARGSNIVSLDGIGKDITNLRNIVRVYGDLLEGNPIISSAQDDASEIPWTREKVFKDSSLYSYQEASELSNTLLGDLKDVITNGRLTCVGLPTLLPGYLLSIAADQEGLTGDYEATEIAHYIFSRSVRDFWSGGFFTQVMVTKEIQDLAYNVNTGVDTLVKLKAANNPFGMKNCFPFTMDTIDNSDSFLYCKIDGGYLEMTDNTNHPTAVWVSNTINYTKDVTSLIVKLTGNAAATTKTVIEVSVDGGSTWQVLTENTVTSPTETGHHLKLRLTMIGDSEYGKPSLSSVALFWT